MYGSAVMSISKPRLSLCGCLSLITSEDGPLTSAITPTLRLAHTHTKQPNSHCVYTHTFSVPLAALWES